MQLENANTWIRKIYQQAVSSGKPFEITPEQLGDIVQRGIERAKGETDRRPEARDAGS